MKKETDLNLSRKIKISEAIASSNAKMRDPPKKENRYKSHRDIFV